MKEGRDAQGRNVNRPPWEEEAGIGERKEQHNTSSAISEGIQQRMCNGASGPGHREPRRSADRGCKQHQKKWRVKEAAMAEEAAVWNVEGAHGVGVQIRRDGE